MSTESKNNQEKDKKPSVKKATKKATKKVTKRKLSVVGKTKRAAKKAAKKTAKKNNNKSMVKPVKKTQNKKSKKKKGKVKAFAVIVVSGDTPSKSMEIMSILAKDSSEAMQSASLICINRKTPNDIIIGALGLKDVKKIAAFLEKSEFIGIN